MGNRSSAFRFVLTAVFVAVLAWVAGTAAFAQDASGARAGASEVVFLAELVVLMAVGRLLGEAMQRIGQPTVMGQLLGGILLGPSVLGWVWPDLQHWIFPAAKEQKVMLDAVSQIGILLLLLLTGMEIDLKLLSKFKRAAISISLSGVAVPFACGVALGWFLPDALLPGADKRLITSLFLGTALSISSIKIVAAIVHEMNFTRRNLGQVIVSSAIVEDTLGWIIIAITFSLARATTIDLARVAEALIGTAIFLVLSFTVGRRLVFQAIRWANDEFQSEFPVITTILVIMGAMALITQAIGVNTVLGAFIAGVLIGDSPILTRHIEEQLRGLIVAFFMPVFFGVAGLGADLTILRDPLLLLMTLGLIGVASIGKFGGAFIGAGIGGLTRREALALAFAMNARGSTEVIVATIGVSMGALTPNLFTMIVAMALTTTMAMPPMLRWGLARVPMSDSERERLAREEAEARGFVSNLERLLLAVDQSPNGRFASRLAGLLAGPRGLPSTVIPVGPDKTQAAAGGSPGERADSETASEGASAREAVESAAKLSKPAQDDDERPDTAEVTVRPLKAAARETLVQEGRKGYDLLFVGIAGACNQNGGFHREVTRFVSGFDGPSAIVLANAVHAQEPERSHLRLLVPVNGTAVARRAAEVAIAIADAVDAPVTVLYVSNSRRSGDRAADRRARGREQAILRDVVKLADQYGRRIETVIATDVAPEAAILARAEQMPGALVVMGVSRRPGPQLFFGDTATAVIENAAASILLLTD